MRRSTGCWKPFIILYIRRGDTGVCGTRDRTPPPAFCVEPAMPTDAPQPAAIGAIATAQLLAKYRTRWPAHGSTGTNFDAERLADFAPATGWNVDDYDLVLPPKRS